MPETQYPSSLPVGTRIDEYQLLSVLGQGSFGITYLAEDINLGARLAIKEYLPDDWAVRDSTLSVRAKSARVGASFERGQNEFLEEARLLARVSHPNIVKVRRFFRTHGTAYIAMEFVAGSVFGDVLDRDYPNGGYPAGALKRLLMAILDGLNSLHAAGIIHRDIKPGNIIIEPEGNPILVDFGAARHVTRAGKTVIVTHGYAPIEQYAEDGEQGPFTDLYAVGALAHRAIIGHPPDQPYKRLGQDDALATNPDIAGRYPPALLAAIDWALAVQPQDRPRSASALLQRLAKVPKEVTLFSDDRTVVLDARTRKLGGSRAGGTRLGAPSGTTRLIRSNRPRRPVPWKLVIAGIIVLLLAGGGTAAYLKAPGMIHSAADTLGAVPNGVRAVPEKVRGIIGLPSSNEAESNDADAAARKAAAAAEAEHLREAPVDPIANPIAVEPPPPTAKWKTRQEAAAAAAAARAEREAAAKAERETAAKAEREAAAAAKQPAKAPSSAPAHTADPRCTSILQNAQVTGGLSDADRNYLREHCH